MLPRPVLSNSAFSSALVYKTAMDDLLNTTLSFQHFNTFFGAGHSFFTLLWIQSCARIFICRNSIHSFSSTSTMKNLSLLTLLSASLVAGAPAAFPAKGGVALNDRNAAMVDFTAKALKLRTLLAAQEEQVADSHVVIEDVATPHPPAAEQVVDPHAPAAAEIVDPHAAQAEADKLKAEEEAANLKAEEEAKLKAEEEAKALDPHATIETATAEATAEATESVDPHATATATATETETATAVEDPHATETAVVDEEQAKKDEEQAKKDAEQAKKDAEQAKKDAEQAAKEEADLQAAHDKAMEDIKVVEDLVKEQVDAADQEALLAQIEDLKQQAAALQTAIADAQKILQDALDAQKV